MARPRVQKRNQQTDQNTNGDQVTKDTVCPEGDDQVPPSLPNLDVAEAEKLSEATGGEADRVFCLPETPEEDRKCVESQVSCPGPAFPCPRQTSPIDTKSTSRLPQNLYRSLSHQPEEGQKEDEDVSVNFPVPDVRKEDISSKSTSRLPQKLYRSLSHQPEEGQKEEEDVSVNFPVTAVPPFTRKDAIQLSGKDLREQLRPPIPGNAENHIKEISADCVEICSDTGIASSAVSKTLLHGCNREIFPLKVHKNDNSNYYAHRKRAEHDQQLRINTKQNSNCGMTYLQCLHAESEHDWTVHLAQKEKVKMYSASRMGNMFHRVRQTDMHEDVGTCCHLGGGYLLTNYHCIKHILCREEDWPYKYHLGDIVVLFFDPSTCARTFQYKLEPTLYSYDGDLDFALLKLDLRKHQELPLHFTTPKLVPEDHEQPVYVVGYQRHPNHPYGQLTVDATALKLRPLTLDFIDHWTRELNRRYEDKIVKIYEGMKLNKPMTYLPLPKLDKDKNVFVLTKLISGASGGFGMTFDPRQSSSPEVHFMYGAGKPGFYYHCWTETSPVHAEIRESVRESFPACMKFQMGLPIGAIRQHIMSTDEKLLNDIDFFCQKEERI